MQSASLRMHYSSWIMDDLSIPMHILSFVDSRGMQGAQKHKVNFEGGFSQVFFFSKIMSVRVQ